MIKKRIATKSNSIYTSRKTFKRDINTYHIQEGSFEYYIYEKLDYPYDYYTILETSSNFQFELRSRGRTNTLMGDWRGNFEMRSKGVEVEFDSKITNALIKLSNFYIYIRLKNSKLEFNVTSEKLLDEEDWSNLHQLMLGLHKQFHFLKK